jgi:lipopolysaccharide assembly outer membrane protein LptD (OstA)
LIRIAATAVVLAVLVGAAPKAEARQAESGPAEAPYELTCETLEYEAEDKLFVARGSVVMEQSGRVITADWMTVSNVSRRGVASGNVAIVDGDDVLHAEFVAFDTRDLTGVVFEGFFEGEAGEFQLHAAEIRKTGDKTYSFEDGVFTTCQCPDPEARKPWTLRSSSADLEVEGYGTARNTTVEILGVPALWFPWMIFPLKTDRQTGFLLPLMGFDDGGVTLGLPFFWAADDWLNVTLTPAWFSKRGFQGNAELEYVYGERSKGDVFGSYIHDEEIQPNTGRTPYGRDRWIAKGTQDAFLPADLTAKADFAFFSDNDYPVDFQTASKYRFDRYVESTAFVGGSWGKTGRLGFVSELVWADDMQAPNDTDRDPYLLQRLPSAALTVLPGRTRGVPWVVTALDAEYTYFYPRKNPAGQIPGAAVTDPSGALFYDTGVDGMFSSQERNAAGLFVGADNHLDDCPVPGTCSRAQSEIDALYQEGEPLNDWGHRLRIAPRLGMPFRLGDVAELYPEVSWYETLYSSDKKGFQSRGLFTARADLRTRLRRRFASGVTHVMEPRVGYALVTQTGQSGDPFFVPNTAIPQERLREFDLDNVVRDPADRIARFNGLTVGLVNRLYSAPGPGVGSRLLADVELVAGYAFPKSEFASIFLDARTFPMRDITTRFSIGFDPERTSLDEALAEGLWTFDKGFLSLGYRYLRDIPNVYENFLAADRFRKFENFSHVNQLDANIRYRFAERWAVTYQVYYQIDGNLLVDNTGGIEYGSRCDCWSLRLEVGWDRGGGIDVGVFYTLTGLGEGKPPRRARLGSLDAVQGVR